LFMKILQKMYLVNLMQVDILSEWKWIGHINQI
jgi:hypothetical protein